MIFFFVIRSYNLQALPGTLSCEKEGWRMDRAVDKELVVHLGYYIHAWYE